MRVAVLNVVGLSKSLIGPDSPALTGFAAKHGCQSFPPVFPAVTCSAQATMTTGLPVSRHGVVGNGWYDREFAETRFWKQPSSVVHGRKLWDELRETVPGFTCAQLFWWFNMHAAVDYSITPRPLYPADGRKVFDIHTQPMGLREEIKADLGPFPFPAFWGPAAGIASSEWIAESARWIETRHSPTLSLVYLPHLDYCLQKFGPGAAEIATELRRIDQVVGELVSFYQSRGVRVMILSEYGISAVSKPVYLNRLFRSKGWLSLKNELGRETLDCGGSHVFAVADHQVAHVYVNDPSLLDQVRAVLEAEPSVETVHDAMSLWPEGPAVARAGDFVVEAESDAWFAYAFWQDDALAPDFARTVEIHRKPGYDPCELFLDPSLRFAKAHIGLHLLKKRIGMRSLLEVIPLDAGLVRGSHGRAAVPEQEQPVILGAKGTISTPEQIHQEIISAVLSG
jgi:predicted AlkP superfamily pyrophosphatase or phosphodiesterase